MDRDPAFPTPHTEYDGRLSSAYVSGLDDGTYYFRARRGGEAAAGSKAGSQEGTGADGVWSDTITLTVAHHPMSRVWPVLGIGSLLFLATLGVLIHGATRSDRDERAGEVTA